MKLFVLSLLSKVIQTQICIYLGGSHPWKIESNFMELQISRWHLLLPEQYICVIIFEYSENLLYYFFSRDHNTWTKLKKKVTWQLKQAVSVKCVTQSEYYFNIWVNKHLLPESKLHHAAGMCLNLLISLYAEPRSCAAPYSRQLLCQNLDSSAKFSLCKWFLRA